MTERVQFHAGSRRTVTATTSTGNVRVHDTAGPVTARTSYGDGRRGRQGGVSGEVLLSVRSSYGLPSAKQGR